MHILRRGLLPVAAAVLFTVLAPADSQGAVAEPQSAAAAAAAMATTITTAQLAAAPAGAAAAVAYWTPERMRHAVSLDPASGSFSAAAPAGAEAGAAPASRSDGTTVTVAPQAAARPAQRALTTPLSMGKAFFHDPKHNIDYACSASAVNSRSRQMVITAGHCVHSGRGGVWMTKWVYVPAYRNGTAPYGVWAAKSTRTFSAWTHYGSLLRDVAVVTTWENNGQKLVNVTGGNGITWNRPRVQFDYLLGYPGNYYNGEIPMFCDGHTSAERGTNRVQIHCNFGHGSSGGPWLRSFNTSSGLGYVDGVTSTGTTTGWDESPYFDTGVGNLFLAQANVV